MQWLFFAASIPVNIQAGNQWQRERHEIVFPPRADRQTDDRAANALGLRRVGRGRSVGKREGIASEKNSEKRSVEFGTSNSKAPKLKIPAANSPDPAAVAAIPPLATRRESTQPS